MCQIVHVLLRVCEDNEFVDFMHSFFSQSILTRFDSFTFFLQIPKCICAFHRYFQECFVLCCVSLANYLLPSNFNNYLSISHYSLLVCYTLLHSLPSPALCIRSIWCYLDCMSSIFFNCFITDLTLVGIGGKPWNSGDLFSNIPVCFNFPWFLIVIFNPYLWLITSSTSAVCFPDSFFPFLFLYIFFSSVASVALFFLSCLLVCFPDSFFFFLYIYIFLVLSLHFFFFFCVCLWFEILLFFMRIFPQRIRQRSFQQKPAEGLREADATTKERQHQRHPHARGGAWPTLRAADEGRRVTGFRSAAGNPVKPLFVHGFWTPVEEPDAAALRLHFQLLDLVVGAAGEGPLGDVGKGHGRVAFGINWNNDFLHLFTLREIFPFHSYRLHIQPNVASLHK